jgi:hypothetical protein
MTNNIQTAKQSREALDLTSDNPEPKSEDEEDGLGKYTTRYRGLHTAECPPWFWAGWVLWSGIHIPPLAGNALREAAH